MSAEAAAMAVAAKADKDLRLKEQEAARAASSPEEIQALLNARLAKSQASRGVPAAGGYVGQNAAPELPKADAEADEQAELVRPVLGRLGTWSRAPDAEASSWTDHYGAGAQGSASVRSQRGIALIRKLSSKTPEPAPIEQQQSEDGNLPIGRLLPGRPRSSLPSHRSHMSQIVAAEGKKVETERSSSVPPEASVATVLWAAARMMRNARANRPAVVVEEPPVPVDDKALEEDEGSFPLATVLMAAIRFARPLAVSGRRVRKVLPGDKALGRDVRRQLRLVVGGLMGSGKSTLCRMLAHLLGGSWVNQDEFSHRGKAAKRAFLEEIEREAQDSKIPVLITDKINTMRQHRREILDAMESGVSGDVVFVQMVHPLDPPDRLDNMVKLCIQRIQGRGEGHRTLHASNPKLQSILKMTAGGVEPMQADELRRFTARITVDMTKDPKESVMQVLADLDKNNLLGRLRLEDLVTEDRLAEALAATKDAEKALAGAAAPSVPSVPKQRKSKAPPVWYWSIEFDAEATATLRALWTGRLPAVSSLDPARDVHVTLLYLAGGSDKEVAARHPHMRGAGEVKQMRERIQCFDGQSVEIQIFGIVSDDRVAAAEVTGLPFPVGNLHPHITLAHRPGVPPKISNELLARRAANQDFESGLKPWLQQLQLLDAETDIREWSKSSGANTADQVARGAADLVEHVRKQYDVVDEDRLAAVKQTLAHAAPGNVLETGVAPFTSPLRLHGRVRGRLRGE